MLPLALLIMVVVLVALTGGAVVWMVLAGIIPPAIATGGSLVVLLSSFVALGLLFARARARRTERDIHTIRRSQAVKEREPLRYRIEDEPADEDTLVRSMPAPASMDAPDETARRTPAPDPAHLALWLEPVVAMPRNETDAWLARAGDGEGPLDPSTLSENDAAEVQLWTIRTAMQLVGKLDAPVVAPIGPELLGDADRARELRSMVENDPAAATRLVLAASRAPLDILAAGRLEDLVDEGVGLALASPSTDDLDRVAAGRAGERGVGFVLLSARELEGAMAARPVRLFAEAGVETVAFAVDDEDTMLRLADMGVSRFAGPAFGSPRRAKAMTGPAPSGTFLPDRPEPEVKAAPPPVTERNGL